MARSTTDAEKTIGEMADRIAKRFRPEKIILFGSFARGAAGPDSDVDLLVIMPVNGSRRDLATRIELEVADEGMAKDIIVVTPEEVERDRDRVGTVVRPAVREGKVLYERAA